MIIPTILEPKLEDVFAKARQFEGVCKLLHVDFGDAEFVKLNSLFRPQDLYSGIYNFEYQVHLMVNDPFNWVERKLKQITTVIFQAEPVASYLETAAYFKSFGYKVGLSIKTETPFPDFYENIDFIQFMTIVPGAQGNAFVPEVIEKIRQFRMIFPSMKIQVDGGINMQNIVDLKSVGVSDFAIGSAILKADDPIEKYKAFLNV